MIFDKEAAELCTLKWGGNHEAQKEYIDHLSFILGPHMDKLPAEVTTMPGKESVRIGLASRHAPKVTPLADDTTTIDGAKLGELNVADDASAVA